VNGLGAFIKINTDNFAFFKNNVMKSASRDFNKTEIAIFESALEKVSLLPITICKIAIFKRNMIENAVLEISVLRVY
jgi:hypothetical protein